MLCPAILNRRDFELKTKEMNPDIVEATTTRPRSTSRAGSTATSWSTTAAGGPPQAVQLHRRGGQGHGLPLQRGLRGGGRRGS